MTEIIVTDDQRSMREFLEILLSKEGYAVRSAPGMSKALALMDEKVPDVVITDLKMKGGSGLDLLKEIKNRAPDVEVVVITAFATTETAIEALKLGAYDYITKPFQVDEIRVVVQRALERQRLLRDNLRMRAELTGRYDYGSLVGKSPRMQEVYRLIDQVAPTRSNVLVTGESGTGKELVARALHLRSPRAEAAFVPIDCASIPTQLMESELFGYVKGAFTGASADRQGLFELADSGTVFLDEIAEIHPSIQVKLLRVLQERSVKRLGEGRDRPVDVRLVAATNRDIDEEVRRGTFRESRTDRLDRGVRGALLLRLPRQRTRAHEHRGAGRGFVRWPAHRARGIRTASAKCNRAVPGRHCGSARGGSGPGGFTGLG